MGEIVLKASNLGGGEHLPVVGVRRLGACAAATGGPL
jgi:hypothetical protein